MKNENYNYLNPSGNIAHPSVFGCRRATISLFLGFIINPTQLTTELHFFFSLNRIEKEENGCGEGGGRREEGKMQNLAAKPGARTEGYLMNSVTIYSRPSSYPDGDF